jgi:hypothetical protein
MNKYRHGEGLSHLISYLCFVFLAIFILSFRSYHVSGQPYTPNEDWSVYWSAAHVSDGIQLNRILTADYFPLDIWISLFGTSAPVTRYLSTLLTALGFAFLFRFCVDFFRTGTALTAVLLLGTLTIVQNLSWQAQPYAALLMIVPGLLLMGARWIYRPTLKSALLYFGAGVVSVYLCTFSILFVFAQAGFYFIFILRNRQRDRQALALFLIIAILALPRVLTFGQINPQTGVPFGIWFAIDLLKVPVSISPVEFMQFILLLTLAIIATGLTSQSTHDARIRLRWNAGWQIGYLLAVLMMFIILITVFANLTIGTLYLIGTLPILIILTARGLSAFPRVVQGIVFILAVILALTTFRNPFAGMSYQDLAARTLLAPDGSNAKLIVAAPYAWQHLPFLHYLSGERVFHILQTEHAADGADLMVSQRTAYPDAVENQPQFIEFIDETSEIWLYAEQFDDQWLSDFSASVLKQYDEISPEQRSWYGDQPSLYGNLKKYIRIPDDLQNRFIFGDQLFLRSWLLKQSVNVRPCEPITVQSWWSGAPEVSNTLSMTLVLANSTDGLGIANADGSPTGRASGTLRPDTLQVDERSIQVPCDVQPGEYSLLIGVYDLAGGQIQQLPVTLSDATSVGRFAYLTTLFVQP